jgi:hypothetical protein
MDEDDLRRDKSLEKESQDEETGRKKWGTGRMISGVTP